MAGEKKKLFIKTWGCQMNVYDSRRMADVLAPLGYAPVDEPGGADMIILNTCHIREKATDKVFSDLGRIRKHKKAREAEGGKMLIAVAGCVAQAEGEVIVKRAPYVDMVFGPQTYHELPQMVMRATGERIVNTEFPVESKFDRLPEETASQGPTAFVSIQEGCDKFCTFCVVPYTRGAEFSRPAVQILDEIKRIRDTGAKEITLLGQNVNAYHGNGPDGAVWNLARLIQAVADIDGIERIRYTTSHPRDMDDELIAAHGSIEKLMPFLHLPVQSGSDAILKAMNRQHTADHYRDIIARVRKARPDIGLSSDFIIGFPGETEEDFGQTVQLVRDIGFASCYSFKYSARPGTPAAVMPKLVSEKVKNERLQRLQNLLHDQGRAFNERMIGMQVPVLFDRATAGKDQLHGRSPWNQPVHAGIPPAKAEKLAGKIINVAITGCTATALSGSVDTAVIQ
ncbi:MAG TPA: tRNA (N6-isopentenyl adenosine(37)-C2)-methylthiotransferase MiaB [Patescibacteria group bacterium]|nr:tRNA (N6-isopentenyl adenosine(37)-C2)-methylthiotransferase MiaB [Patescibacteria group bacterium]